MKCCVTLHRLIFCEHTLPYYLSVLLSDIHTVKSIFKDAQMSKRKTINLNFKSGIR